MVDFPLRRFPELSQGAEFIRRSRSGVVYESEELVRRILYLTRKISGSEGFMRLSYLMQAIHILYNSTPDRNVLADIPKPRGKMMQRHRLNVPRSICISILLRN